MNSFAFATIYAAKRRQVRRFFRLDEDGGTSTIEFVLWLPIFILILALIIDVCFLFLAQAIMFDVASDTARRWAIGTLSTTAEVETFAQAQGSFQGVQPVVNASSSNCAVTVELVFTLADIDVFGILGFVSNDELKASVTQLAEAC